MEPHRRGDLTEQIVITELKKRDISVSTPVGNNERYDLVLEKPDGELLRAQVKTGRLKDGVVRFKGVSQHTNSSGHVYKQYGDGVDCFLVHCGETEETYLVDSEEVGTSMHLRIDPPTQKTNQINWAENYRLDQQWPPSNHNRHAPAVSAAIDTLESVEGSVYVDPTREDSRNLLFVDTDGETYQIRVETGWIVDGRVRFTPSETAEYHLIYCDDLDDLLSVHSDEFDESISFRVDTKNTRNIRSNPAEEYRFENNWPPVVVGSSPTDPTPELTQFISRLEEGQMAYDRVECDGEKTAEVYCEESGFRVRVEPAWIEEGLLRFNASGNNAEYYAFKNPEKEEWNLVSDDSFENSVSLRIEPPEKEDSRINFAEDYLLEKSWPV
ncbi:group I intron-associated PD-(D/E)XK endonuclease [Halorubrum amylolyticum]|uniref:group I intron-associated PD-(D/E)XK endonuclease n=1 Tax=Halorubrum amylolyticum TaxID=2508724 RepID=UPI001009059B|nr:group I intron-associated PD-(D/E)XK endonuclease [Halorubrum amylolyticum]